MSKPCEACATGARVAVSVRPAGTTAQDAWTPWPELPFFPGALLA